MPAQAGIQGRKGMDTGFRRYDGSLMPIRCPDRTCTGIFEGGSNSARKEPRPFDHQEAFGGFAITYEIHEFCETGQAMAALCTRLHRNILELFNNYGVQIMTMAYEGDP